LFINTYFITPLKGLRAQVASIIEKEARYLNNNGKKRVSHFIKGFKVLDLFDKEGSMILKSFYFWARFIDDVIDRDRKHILSNDIKGFIEEKKHFLAGVAQKHASFREIHDEQDLLLIYAYRAAKEILKIDIMDSAFKIFETMEYDFQRSKAAVFPLTSELNDYFDKLDITSIYEALRIMNESGITKEDLEGLNQATRLRYTVRDLVEDISNNIYNISQEELIAYNIKPEEFSNAKSFEELWLNPRIHRWIDNNTTKIFLGLKRSRQALRGKKIKLKTRLALFLCFKLPCRLALIKWGLKLYILSD